MGRTQSKCLSIPLLSSLWWNAPEIAMEMESVFLELAIVFQDFWVQIVQEQPVPCSVVATGSTPRAAASVSAAGKAPSVTCPLPSVSTRSVGVVGFVSWALVLATRDTKEKIVKKLTA